MADTDDTTLSAELLQRIATGSKSAEQELVTRYARGLRYILLRQCQDPELAADLAQDALLICLEKARQNLITNPQALSAYIRQTGVNLLSAHYRKERRRRTEASEVVFEAPDTGPEILIQLHGERALILVTTLMNELSVKRDRELLKGYFLQNQSKTELCQRLALSPDNFDRVLSRARQRLRQLVVQALAEQDPLDSGKELQSLLLMALLLSPLLTPELNNLHKFSTQVRESTSTRHFVTDTPFYGSVSQVATGAEEADANAMSQGKE